MPPLDAPVIVVGAGHAGIEAALAAARMGVDTLVITLGLGSIGRMSCNPAIGGLAKGQIVREIDALGGEMARAADATGIQFRMLNTGKGPAVRSPRAQCDKVQYARYMRDVMAGTPRITVLEDAVEDLVVDRGRIAGVVARRRGRIPARAVIITTGTFLGAVQHCGEERRPGGRIGEPSADLLSEAIRRLGFEMGRLKTGTPPRLRRGSIDFSRVAVQPGDPVPVPFSHFTEGLPQPQIVCWTTFTNAGTHRILRENLHRSPMYSGQIRSVGPRYCPSVEDKVVRFADRDRHLVFLEPESLSTDEVYCNGLSTSTPPDVQERFLRTIAGLERAEILRHGYAVEYDYALPHQLRPTLETRGVGGLYFAGQINGTSGYEEAAGQGFVAGANAALALLGRPALTLGRDEAYIGVMIDDLITMEHREPYRMFTSRAEYRLSLRSDNADRRLMGIGGRLGLIPADALRRLGEREREIAAARRTLEARPRLLASLRRPDRTFEDVARESRALAAVPFEVRGQVEIEAKYGAYFELQQQQIDRFRSLEDAPIPDALDFSRVRHLRSEAREKLARFRPSSLGQAARIAGVSPADIQVLMVLLR